MSSAAQQQASPILSREDLMALTGSKMASKVKEALRQKGIGFIPRLDGWPGTTWEAVNAGLGVKRDARPENDEPDLSFLHEGKR